MEDLVLKYGFVKEKYLGKEIYLRTLINEEKHLEIIKEQIESQEEDNIII
jgi:hypothetical protein